MKKVLPILLITSLVLLSSCSDDKVEEIVVEKTPYTVETTTVENLPTFVNIEKTGRISWTQEISVSSNASWKVELINFSEGQKVTKWQTVVSLSDSVSNLWIKVSQAKNTLSNSNLAYENTKSNNNKSLEDAKLTLEKAKNKVELTKSTNANNIALSKANMESSDLSNPASNASITLAKAEENLKKLKVDYNKTIQDNVDTLNSMISNTNVQYNDFKILFSDSLNDYDEILWITSGKRNLNDSYEDYLWALRTSTLVDAKTLFIKVNEEKDKYLKILPVGQNITEDNIKEVLNKIEEGYSVLNNLIEVNDVMFKNSVNTDTDLAWVIATSKWHETNSQSKTAAFISFKNNSTSFLNTYKTTEQSLLLNLQLQEKELETSKLVSAKNDSDSKINYNQVVSSSSDNLKDAEITVKNAEISLTNIINSNDISLKQALNQIETSKNNLLESQKEYNKLFITSPINWIISDIFVDKGEEVGNSTAIFKVVSDSNREIEISVPESELSFISVGKEVDISTNGKNVKWKIISVSNVADKNLNYKVIISLDDNLSFIWGTVNVSIKSESTNILIPLKYVTTLTNNKWYIYTLKDWLPTKYNVNLWKVWSDKITILDEIPKDTLIITTDMENYDANKFNIVIK